MDERKCDLPINKTENLHLNHV
uniref:Uncharacterized protein n=1 Tax=Anguilla anguilla TaxID=7936 RepID=A0A0E9S0U8_ANGAN